MTDKQIDKGYTDSQMDRHMYSLPYYDFIGDNPFGADAQKYAAQLKIEYRR
jgi:hypothetical protein